MLDLTAIANAVLALIAALITAFLIPWLKHKTTDQQQQNLAFWTAKAVTAAEEYFREAGRGEEKFKFVEDFLAGHKIKLDEQKLAVLIQGTVWELIRQFEGDAPNSEQPAPQGQVAS